MLLEFVSLVTPYLSDQGEPILVSGLALQAALKSSTAVSSEAWCGEVTSTIVPGSRLCGLHSMSTSSTTLVTVTAVKCPARPLAARRTAPPRKMLLWTPPSDFGRWRDMLCRDWYPRPEGLLQKDH